MVTGIETVRGKMILVMVGATNVGSMSFAFDQNIKTNNPRKKEVVYREYDNGRPLIVGNEFGTFHLGSTVVAIYEEKWGLGHIKRTAVEMGQKLL